MQFSLSEMFVKFSELKWYTIAILCVLALLVVLSLAMRKKQMNVRVLTYGALCLSVGFVLSCIVLFRMPQGGSITPAGYLPVLFFAYAFGPVYGLLAATAYGLLQLVQGFYAMHPISLLLDYILAYASLGLTGFFKKRFILGMIVAGLAMVVFQTASGVLFYAEYAPEGWNPLWYSIVYNGTTVGVNILVCILISCIKPLRRVMDRLRDQVQNDRLNA